jgi:hypothetical protein
MQKKIVLDSFIVVGTEASVSPTSFWAEGKQSYAPCTLKTVTDVELKREA